LPPKSVAVNIGAGCGTSGLCMVEAENIAHSYTVDYCEKDNKEGNLDWERKSMVVAGYDPIPPAHTQILSDSAEAGHKWAVEGDKVDFIFVDAGHSYEQCRDDILAWLPNLKEGGLMVVHDYYGNFPGVIRAVNELLLGQKVCIERQAEGSLIAFYNTALT